MLTLYLDEDAGDHRLVKALRDYGFDVVAGRDIGNFHTDDEIHLIEASRLGRVVYTFNVGDFARLHYTWIAEGRPHAGIIVNPHQGMSIGLQRQRIAALARKYRESGMGNQFEYV